MEIVAESKELQKSAEEIRNRLQEISSQIEERLRQIDASHQTATPLPSDEPDAIA